MQVTSATVSDSFISSKKDKLRIKHSAFVSRIEKGRAKKPLKRRRPGKKLVTGLESLGDVLGEIGDTLSTGNGAIGGRGRGNEGKIEMKSAKSRPGAMKKKEKSDRLERERFGKNMAVLIGVGAQAQTQTKPLEQVVGGMDIDAAGGMEKGKKDVSASGTASRWAALRGFIEQTMEQKEEFRKS